MQNSRYLEFPCISCNESISFCIYELQETPQLSCPGCRKAYRFDEDTLLKQLEKFTRLCRTIAECEDLLGSASVGVDVEGKQVKIPYKILLTRLNSTLDLNICGKPLSFRFRIEPAKEVFLGEAT